jgi:RsiW-degrading membrane proteinase PrsW (M82 family)
LKEVIAIVSLLWASLSGPALLGFCCATISALGRNTPEAIGAGLFSFMLVVITGGGGTLVALHAWNSSRGKPSKPLHLPPAWLGVCLFALCVVSGSFIIGTNFAPALFFPPLLLVAAATPPLLAIAWFTGGQAEGLTWRRGMVAFAGGATVSVVLAAVLEILLPGVVLALVAGLADVALPRVEALLRALAGKEIAAAITSPGFIFVFVQLAVIAPLAEELAKPLVTLPLLGRLTRRDAFLVAAMAGAGFAALENVLYAGFGLSFWAGILVVRALGGAIHPLGSGLVGLGWRDLLGGESQAGLKWALRFGLAAGMHALWNGGSLLVITLAGARFFGNLPPAIDVLGLSAAGTTLALLVVLGLVALWMGRAVAQGAEAQAAPGVEPSALEFILSDRTAAIWALACLAAIVPAGITGLQLLMR